MSKISDRLKRLVEGLEERHSFKLESAVLNFTRLLRQRMEGLGIGPTDLANRIEVKPPYVSKILRGKSNFTLDSIIKLCSAVDANFVFDVVPKEKNQYGISAQTVVVCATATILSKQDHDQIHGEQYSYNRVTGPQPVVKYDNYDSTLYTSAPLSF